MNDAKAEPMPPENQFDKEARTWDQNPVRVELANAVANAVADTIPPDPDRNVLDFGGGVGLVSLQLAPYAASVTVTDTSRGMLAVLQERADAASIRNVKPLFMSPQEEPEIEDSYGLILTSMVLHHIEDIGGTLRRFFQWTSVGGWLALVDLETEDGTFHSDEQIYVHRGFDPQELAAQAEKAGFITKSIRTIHTIHRPDRDESGRDYPVFLLAAQKPANESRV